MTVHDSSPDLKPRGTGTVPIFAACCVALAATPTGCCGPARPDEHVGP
ncbi:MAG: hypothetical protein M3460_18185 [Actinomycetota bacterium]|nr:hypothetical protein [Actinomycetota bacterium]